MSDQRLDRRPDERLYEVAERQAGYFSAAQAQAVGVSWRQLSYHVSSGRLLRVAWGVYRLALFPAMPHEDLVVAWLRAGPDAVISHESALALYELSDALPARVHVTVPRAASRRRPGLALHTNALERRYVTRVAGVPTTTVARTIADVAASGLPEELVVQAAQEAVQRGLVSGSELEAYAQSRGGRPRRLIRRALRRLMA